MDNSSSDSETNMEESKQLFGRERAHFHLVTHSVINSNHLTWDDIILSAVLGSAPSFCTSAA